MAERRMFAKKIIDEDWFLDMPASARLLYFDLAMRADDDGFVSPKKVMRMTGASQNDLDVLVAKKFVLPFESGVVVIRQWHVHNLIRADRYHPTIYKDEKATLERSESGYIFGDGSQSIDLRPPIVDRTVNHLATNGKPSIGKDSIGKDSNNMSSEKEFDEVWKLYPRKDGKQDARKAFIKARKEGVCLDDIIAGIGRYIEYIKATNTKPIYIKMGSSFFNQRAWESEWSVQGMTPSFSSMGEYAGEEAF